MKIITEENWMKSSPLPFWISLHQWEEQVRLLDVCKDGWYRSYLRKEVRTHDTYLPLVSVMLLLSDPQATLLPSNTYQIIIIKPEISLQLTKIEVIKLTSIWIAFVNENLKKCEQEKVIMEPFHSCSKITHLDQSYVLPLVEAIEERGVLLCILNNLWVLLRNGLFG